MRATRALVVDDAPDIRMLADLVLTMRGQQYVTSYFVNEADVVICSQGATFFDSHVTGGLVSALEPIGLMRRIGLGETLRMALAGNDERVTALICLDSSKSRDPAPIFLRWDGTPYGPRLEHELIATLTDSARLDVLQAMMKAHALAMFEHHAFESVVVQGVNLPVSVLVPADGSAPDNEDLEPLFQAIIEQHARFLKSNTGRRVVIEGHTDERGGREYNLALGQRRSEAVRRALGLLGVPDSRIEAVSFGEEKPATQGGEESAWSQNRRAEISYR